MPLVRRRLIEPAAAAPEAKPDKALRRVVRKVQPQKVIHLEPAERNVDGSSYAETIQRYRDKVRNPMTAIRAKCVECCNGSLKEVTECTVTACALYPFRKGKNPFRKQVESRIGVNPFKKQEDGDEEDE